MCIRDRVTLNRQGLKHKLIGPSSGNIVYQYPVGGSDVPAGSTVYPVSYTHLDVYKRQNVYGWIPEPYQKFDGSTVQ